MPNKNKVLIVVPLYKPHFSESEQFSINQLEKNFKHYDKCFIMPEGLNFFRSGFKNFYFPKKYFSCRCCYSALLIEKFFYSSFKNYDFILIHQLDSIVFYNDLEKWCNKNYDYIGAPVFGAQKENMRNNDWVGNGGLSLRKVNSSLHVLSIREKNIYDKFKKIFFFLVGVGRMVFLLFEIGTQFFKRSLKVMTSLSFSSFQKEWRHSSILHFVNGRGQLHEDAFWATVPIKIDPNFKIPSIEEAAYFAFETQLKRCFAITRGHIPMGAHAWASIPHQKQFWEKVSKTENPKNYTISFSESSQL